MKNPNPDALKLVYWAEIEKTYKLLSYQFNKVDIIKDGKISI